MAAPAQGSARILEELGKFKEEFAQTKKDQEETNQRIQEILTQIHSDVKECLIKVSSARPAKAASTKAAGSPKEEAAPKESFASNSMYWMYQLYDQDSTLVGKYFSEERIEEAKKAIEKDPKTKSKVGNARKREEIKYLWSKYVKGDKELSAQIKTAYDKAKMEAEKPNKTPAGKEEKPADEEASEETEKKATPKKATPKKAAATASSDAEEEEKPKTPTKKAAATPTKKATPTKTPTKKAAAAAATSDAEEDNEPADDEE